MGPKETDLRTRVGELEATVSGLTQELVEANERIRQLEAALDEFEGPAPPAEEPGVGAADGGTESETSAKQMGGTDEAEEETPSDLDDIIVA